MSDETDFSKLKFILEFLADIDRINERHNGLAASLDDFEGRNALLMCLFQAGEILNKIESPRFRRMLPVELTYSMRNIIAYDHAGINNRAISGVITHDIPKLRNEIKAILDSAATV